MVPAAKLPDPSRATMVDAVFALADRISVLVYGGIIASGSVQEVRSDPEVRRAYLGEEEAP